MRAHRCAVAVLAIRMQLAGDWHTVVPLGTWFRAGEYEFSLNLLADRLSVPMMAVTTLLVGIIGSFSVRYLHRDPGYLRFFVFLHLFGFAALSAVILNKAMSLVVVLTALPARLVAVSASEVAGRWPVAVNLLAGSLLGAWAGASWAVRMRGYPLYKVLAALMVLMAAALLVTHTSALGGHGRGGHD